MDPYGFSGWAPGFAVGAAPSFVNERLDKVAQQFAESLQRMEEQRQLTEAINSPEVQGALKALLAPPTPFKPGTVPPPVGAAAVQQWGRMGPAAGYMPGQSAAPSTEPSVGMSPELASAFVRAAQEPTGRDEKGRPIITISGANFLAKGTGPAARADLTPAKSAFAQANQQMTPKQYELLTKLAPQLVQRFSPIEVTERTRLMEEGKNRRLEFEGGLQLGKLQAGREALDKRLALEEKRMRAKSKTGGKPWVDYLYKRANLYRQKLAQTAQVIQSLQIAGAGSAMPGSPMRVQLDMELTRQTSDLQLWNVAHQEYEAAMRQMGATPQGQGMNPRFMHPRLRESLANQGIDPNSVTDEDLQAAMAGE